MTEEWRDVPKYEGRYQVSNLGRVKSLARCYRGICRPETILKLQLHTRGYMQVYLRCPGRKMQKAFLHRLVAAAFLENADNRPIVNHLDRNKAHNSVVNLEWATAKENTAHWVADDLAHSDIPF